MSKPIIIMGDGGHAAVLVEILRLQNKEILGYTSPKQQQDFYDITYLGPDAVIFEHSCHRVELALGLGMVTVSSVRSDIFTKFKEAGYSFVSIIHPASIISATATLAEGIQVMAGAIVQSNTIIGENVIVNTGAIIDHDGLIGKHSHIAPGVTLSGGVMVGENCHIGTGTAIIQGISIGHKTLIGAGSVVIKNIKNNQTAYGVPAKEV